MEKKMDNEMEAELIFGFRELSGISELANIISNMSVHRVTETTSLHTLKVQE